MTETEREALVEELARAIREYVRKSGIVVTYEEYIRAILPIITRLCAEARAQGIEEAKEVTVSALMGYEAGLAAGRAEREREIADLLREADAQSCGLDRAELMRLADVIEAGEA